MKDLLDIYLKQYDTNRYEVSKISGISQQVLSLLNDNDKGSDSYTGRHLKAISMIVGKTPGEVMDEIIKLENWFDGLNGLLSLTSKYEYDNLEKLSKVKILIKELSMQGVELSPFTFNRLDGKELSMSDIDKVVDNVIEMLTKMLLNVQMGEHPMKDM